jgi:hypothetical protein
VSLEIQRVWSLRRVSSFSFRVGGIPIGNLEAPVPVPVAVPFIPVPVALVGAGTGSCADADDEVILKYLFSECGDEKLNGCKRIRNEFK